MIQIPPLNRLLNRLILTERQSFRWVINNRNCTVIQTTRIPHSSTKKIETVYKEMLRNFSRFNNVPVNQDAFEKLGLLIPILEDKARKYKSSHGFLYLLFSRIFGNIDTLTSELVNELKKIRSYHTLQINVVNKVAGQAHVPVNPSGLKSKISTVDSPAELTPPVYAPYKEVAPDTEAVLKNHIKDSRLKFYELFAEKLKLSDEWVFPLVDISDDHVSIRIPRVLHGEFSHWFDERLKERQISYKTTDLFTKSKLGTREITKPTLFDGVPCMQAFSMSLEEAQKLLQPIPEKGISNLSKLWSDRELKIHHGKVSKAWGNEPSFENTVSLTLTQINVSGLQNDATTVSSGPLVEFNQEGMFIKVPTEQVNMKNVIKQIFNFKQVFREQEPEEQVCDGKTYHIFHLNEDEVENFLKQLGLDKIPAKGLFERYKDGNITYLQHLVETGRYHAYRPVRTPDPLESIRKSLAMVVPNELQIEPHVAYHPRGWISIKMTTDLNPEYNQSLSIFLKSPIQKIQHEFNRQTYLDEIIIHESEIPSFLKTLKLNNSPQGISYSDLLTENKTSFEISIAETERKLDVVRTISRTLSTLEPNVKVVLREFSPQSFPEYEMKFIEVVHLQSGLEIRVPKVLHDHLVCGVEFGEYLSHVFALNGALRKEGRRDEFYCISVPKHRVKSFLENDLALRTLPSAYIDNGIETFYNQYVRERNERLGLQKHIPLRGAVVNLKLRNPSIKVESIGFTDEEIMYAIRDVLDDHSQKEACVSVFDEIFLRIANAADGFEINEGKNPEILKGYLNHITAFILNNDTISPDRKKNFLIQAAEGCKGLDLTKQLIHIQNIYQKLTQEEILKVVNELLDKNPKKQTYVAAFKDIFKRISSIEGESRDIEEIVKCAQTIQTIPYFLWLIAKEVLKNDKISLEHKEETLIDIAIGCNDGVCAPGRLTKIQNAYQKLMQPELVDDLKFILLDKIEQFKMATLSELFKSQPHNVHIINFAQVHWGDQFGLNKEVGKMDEGNHGVDVNFRLLYCTEENKKKFEKMCKEKLLHSVFESIRASKDRYGCIQYLDIIRDKLREILAEEGLTPSQITEEIEQLFPKQKDLRKIFDSQADMGNIAVLIKSSLGSDTVLPESTAIIKQLYSSEISRANEVKKIFDSTPDSTEQNKLRMKFNDPGNLAILIKVHFNAEEMSKENIDKIKKLFPSEQDRAAEMSQIFSSNDDENETIRKEVVTLLLIKLGVLSP